MCSESQMPQLLSKANRSVLHRLEKSVIDNDGLRIDADRLKTETLTLLDTWLNKF